MASIIINQVNGNLYNETAHLFQSSWPQFLWSFKCVKHSYGYFWNPPLLTNEESQFFITLSLAKEKAVCTWESGGRISCPRLCQEWKVWLQSHFSAESRSPHRGNKANCTCHSFYRMTELYLSPYYKDYAKIHKMCGKQCLITREAGTEYIQDTRVLGSSLSTLLGAKTCPDRNPCLGHLHVQLDAPVHLLLSLWKHSEVWIWWQDVLDTPARMCGWPYPQLTAQVAK